jgi:hypothetical protein
MLEILFLRYFVARLRAIAVEKNRKPSLALLGVLGWLGGEVTGLVLGMQGNGPTSTAYVYALMGAAAGAFAAYLYIASRPALPAEGDLPIARVV